MIWALSQKRNGLFIAIFLFGDHYIKKNYYKYLPAAKAEFLTRLK